MIVRVAVARYVSAGKAGVGVGGTTTRNLIVLVDPFEAPVVEITWYAVVEGAIQQRLSVCEPPEALHDVPLSRNDCVNSADEDAFTVYPN